MLQRPLSDHQNTHYQPKPPIKTFSKIHYQSQIPRNVAESAKDLSPAAEALQRKKFLERNCIAASRCREKKKEYISRVEERKVELQRTNVRLKAENEYLLKEINSMTEVLLDCGNCARRGDVKKLVEGEGWEARRLGDSLYRDGGTMHLEGACDESEDCDKSTERGSIFSSDEWDSCSSNSSPAAY
jgi:hypothetical protein